MAGTGGSTSTATRDREFEILCDDVGEFLRRYTVAEDGTVVPVDTELDGTTTYVVIGTVRRCVAPRVPANPAIIGTIQRQQGAGTVTIPAGARSITVVVASGTASVAIGVAPAVLIPQGASFTWGVDRGGPDGETLQDAYAFTGVASSDFYVSSTREV